VHTEGHFARQRKQFFFEKKNQKTFGPWRASAGGARDSDSKVFCFFSSEKKCFLPYPTISKTHPTMVRKIAKTAANR
jgi:hypothetical protein